MDATPLTLGQEFSAYAAQLDFGLKALKKYAATFKPISIGWNCGWHRFEYAERL